MTGEPEEKYVLTRARCLSPAVPFRGMWYMLSKPRVHAWGGMEGTTSANMQSARGRN